MNQHLATELAALCLRQAVTENVDEPEWEESVGMRLEGRKVA
jgi:hypothetical protein